MHYGIWYRLHHECGCITRGAHGNGTEILHLGEESALLYAFVRKTDLSRRTLKAH
jgi:hypothetical protein